jgi:hypothetical protein
LPVSQKVTPMQLFNFNLMENIEKNKLEIRFLQTGEADFVRLKDTKIFNFVGFARMLCANGVTVANNSVNHRNNRYNSPVSVVPTIKQ